MPATTQNTATITAKIGPATTVTTGSYTGVSDFQFDLANQTLELSCAQGKPVFAINASTTFTFTLTAGVYALTVS